MSLKKVKSACMKVLITGGTGFVGEAIIEKLVENNFEICALINQKSAFKKDSIAEKHCRILRADIRDSVSLNKISIKDNFDAFIHSAGLAHQFGEINEQDFWDVNVQGTKNIAALAAKNSVKQFVLISSVAVYGNSSAIEREVQNKVLTEAKECRPEEIYAVTKFESEKTAQEICKNNQINLTVLRLATVIGENDRGNVVRLIKAIDQGRFFWIGKGSNLKSLIYKGDVASACLEVLNRPDQTGTYNLTADALTMKEIVGEIHWQLKRKNPRISIPAFFLQPAFQINRKTLNVKRVEKISETIRKWLADDVFSGEKFRKEYNFHTETSIREAIKREVESYLRSK